jgi:hypothetical protein
VKRPKYGNRITEVDGIKFHSAKEAKRYTELKVLARAGIIRGLILQPRFPIIVNDVKVCTYISDFEYVENGVRIVNDVKGFKTDVYVIKKKLMKSVYGIDILET